MPGVTVTISANVESVNSITADDPLVISGGGLSVAATSTISGGLAMTDGSLTANGSGVTLRVKGPTTIATDTTLAGSLTEVEALNGADIEMPALDQVSGGPVLFRSNGTGGKLDIGTLASIAGPAGQDNDTTLEADGGGSLVASALTSIGGADVVVVANGAGSEVSLPKLATITADTTHAGSLTEVEALNGGDVQLPVLGKVSGGPVLFRSNGTGGKLDIGTLASGGSLVGSAGQDNDTTLEADGGGLHGGLRPDQHRRGRCGGLGGIQLTLAALTSYTGGVGDATSLEHRAPIACSRCPQLTTITTDTTHPAP